MIRCLGFALASTMVAAVLVSPAAAEFGDHGAGLPAATIPLDSETSSLFALDAAARIDAQGCSVTSSYIGGFLGGLLLGPAGISLVVVLQSESDPAAADLDSIRCLDECCEYMYLDSFRKEVQSRKRSAAVSAGIAGTAILAYVILNAVGDR
jgi:hypothetical protein